MRNIKQLTLLILCFLISTITYSQKLSVDEVLSYLEEVINEDIETPSGGFDGKRYVTLAIEEDQLIINYCWVGNPDISFLSSEDGFCNAMHVDINNVQDFTKEKSDLYTLRIYCEGGSKDCVFQSKEEILNYYANSMHDSPKSFNHYDYVNLFYFNKEETQDIVFNGLIYSLYEYFDEKNNIIKQTPFTTQNINHSTTNINTEIIQLAHQGGVSTLDADIAGVHRTVILDSGASTVALPESVEAELLLNGVISEENYLPNAYFSIADGSTVVGRQFIAPYIQIGDIVVKNVECSVIPNADIILLGKSYLNRFKKWSIDNETNQLLLQY